MHNVAPTDAFPMSLLDDEMLSWVYLRRLIEASDPYINALLDQNLDARHLAQSILIGDSKLDQAWLERVTPRRFIDPRRDAEFAEAQHWQLIHLRHAHWPKQFTRNFANLALNVASLNTDIRGIHHRPFALWVRSNTPLSHLSNRAVTVVGTRAPSQYGKHIAKTWSALFRDEGYTLVSGGALGIDTVVHQTALQGQHIGNQPRRTIVVTAGSLETTYPARNRDLFQDIVAAGGALISEYPPGTAPARHRFLTRNRLAAGLGQATVLVEAALRSGALNTINWANGMNLPTFAIPGSVQSITAQGPHKAIQDHKAMLAAHPQDVVEVMEPIGSVDPVQGVQLTLDDPSTRSPQPTAGPALSWEETAVFDALPKHQAMSLAGIQQDTGLPLNIIVRHLRRLEHLELARREGSGYRRAAKQTK